MGKRGIMRLKALFTFVAIGLIGLLAGCSAAPQADETILTLNEITTWVQTQVPEYTREDIVLPSTHPELGGIIQWTSFDEDVVDADGTIHLESGVSEAILEYTVTLNSKAKQEFIVVTVSALTLEDVALEFEKQFSAYITRDYDVRLNIYPGYEITWTSSDESIFSNEGIYTQPVDNMPLTITYEIHFGEDSQVFTKDVIVQGVPFIEKANEIGAWIEENYLPNRVIDSALTLPSEDEKYGATIDWIASNPDVISSSGVVRQYAFDRYLTLYAEIRIDDLMTRSRFDVIVKANPVTTLTEKVNSFLDAIAVSEIDRLSFTYYSNINQYYNYIPFYDSNPTPVVEQIIALRSVKPDSSRPGTKLYSVEFVTIHDTANNNSTAGAQTHANILTNGFSASWHYSIDDKGAYHSIPNDEVAWHAGDGARAFELVDTNVVAGAAYPKQTITTDGYFALNGVKTTIKAPTSDGRTLSTKDITPSGIYTTIGENGNYWMNRSYFNTDYGKISNHGGNRNSIGIESAVNAGTDYGTTQRLLAKLVAKLLVDNGLDVDRVMQHNNFSGKDCPLTLRRTEYWNTFLDLVSMEKFALEELQNVSFIWHTQTAILNTKGQIALNKGTTTLLNYSVDVTYDTVNTTKVYSTILK